MSRKTGLNTAELVARLSRDEGFAREWTVEEPVVTLAANIARLRHARGMTQHELASLAGMRQPRIAAIERGDANLEVRTLARIANALGVDLATLHRREEDQAASLSAADPPAQAPRKRTA